jgi:hypothetical protein
MRPGMDKATQAWLAMMAVGNTAPDSRAVVMPAAAADDSSIDPQMERPASSGRAFFLFLRELELSEQNQNNLTSGNIWAHLFSFCSRETLI